VEHAVIRDAGPADVDVLRNVFRRALLSNDGDRAHLLVNPETLEWATESVGAAGADHARRRHHRPQ
jgi:hypothetical protein